jgi:hypothetical protein
LLLYDIAGRRIIQLTDGAGQVMGWGGFVWWSTGTGEDVAWHALDLHSLSS